jgi:hypothetical protein
MSQESQGASAEAFRQFTRFIHKCAVHAGGKSKLATLTGVSRHAIDQIIKNNVDEIDRDVLYQVLDGVSKKFRVGESLDFYSAAINYTKPLRGKPHPKFAKPPSFEARL